jgi:succinate--hydroxymethylglutarate CoA-transferase
MSVKEKVRETEPKNHGMLEGLRVIEFGQIAAAPFTGSLLADLGADVVKVERPDVGDGMRQWPPLSKGKNGEEYSENFASVNRNKRSICANLKDPEDVAQVKILCEHADVLVENYRPGVLPRLGLGPEDIAAINPRLVYCSISGYGQVGPYRTKGAFDVTVQAMSGLMSVTGEEGGEPVKAGVPFGDFGAGLYAAYTILAAVMQSRQTGKGAYLDCSMLGAMIGVSALQTSEYFGTGVAPKALGSAHPRNAPYQGFAAKDGFFAVAAGNDKLWADLCKLLDLTELLDDPRFTTQFLRAANQKELSGILAPVFLTESVDHWVSAIDEHGIPCAPVNDFPTILGSEQVKQLGLVETIKLPNGSETQTTTFPVRIDGRVPKLRSSPPNLGEHTAEVLKDWVGD